MTRFAILWHCGWLSFPHARGDDPGAQAIQCSIFWIPHTRGDGSIFTPAAVITVTISSQGTVEAFLKGLHEGSL